jgi:hypothetical protein
MPPKEILQARMPGPDEFFRRYVFRRRPVVITDLFEGQEISRMATLEDAAEGDLAFFGFAAEILVGRHTGS